MKLRCVFRSMTESFQLSDSLVLTGFENEGNQADEAASGRDGTRSRKVA